jgi:hypothetical protein
LAAVNMVILPLKVTAKRSAPPVTAKDAQSPNQLLITIASPPASTTRA